MSLSRFLALLTLASFCSLFAQEDEINLDAAAGNNIGRLEENDGDEEVDKEHQLSGLGTVVFPVTFKEAGKATFAVYYDNGQLLRVLGQVLPVEAREYKVRWDGLDLFGNPVPEGTSVNLKVFFNPGVQTFYEFSVGDADVAPWPGEFERNGRTMAGGWLGDHSAPNGIAALGDRVFIGSSLSEEGDNLAALTLDGQKIWGAKVDGWDGVKQIQAGKEDLAVVSRKGARVYRIPPDLKADKNGRRRLQKNTVYSGKAIERVAVHENNLLVIEKNRASFYNPLKRAFSGRNIDYQRSRPQVLNSTPPSDFHLSPQAAFGTTFYDPGSPQTGAIMIPHEGYALVILVFKEPQSLRSALLPTIKGVKRLEIHALEEGTKYTDDMNPLNRKASGGVLDMTLSESGDEWVSVGESKLDQDLNMVHLDGDPVTTEAVLIKAYPLKDGQRNWKPRLPMCLFFKEKIETLANPPKSLSFPTRLVKDSSKAFGTASGYKVRTEYPISEIYPFQVIMDYGKEQKFNGALVKNAVNPDLFFAVLPKGKTPENASNDDWMDIGRIRRNYNKKLRHKTSSRSNMIRATSFGKGIEARYVRITSPSGLQGGKWGQSKDDAHLGETANLLLINTPILEENSPSHTLVHVDFLKGRKLSSWSNSEYNLPALDYAPDGKLYSIANGRLNETTLNLSTGKMSHKALNKLEFDMSGKFSMDVSKDRILLGDRQRRQLLLFDRKGKLLKEIGPGHGREPGPWNPYVIHKASAVALASSGDLWLAEASFAPKRVGRFDKNGKHIRDYWGNPMYGGGGRLDPSLDMLWYRGMEFSLDWKKGSSKLTNHNDVVYAPKTLDTSASSFSFTHIGRPQFVDGRRYIVSGLNVVRKPDDSPVFIPAMKAGYAHENPFLLKKDVWNRHWGKQNLSGKFFVWCDHNGDGDFQVEEVEITDAKTLPPGIGGGATGPGLSFWSKNTRWKPRSFTKDGVPIYKLEDIKAFNIDELHPHFPIGYTLSGSSSAKPHFGGIPWVTSDGNLITEAQPFVVQADGSLLGGPAPKKSGFIPPFAGEKVATAWAWAGGGKTKSPVGEIAVINSYKGAWHVWAADYGVMVERFFTGEKGKLNGREPVRGMETTQNYFGWEGWHSDFVQAHTGKFYAQGGKSFHSIHEVKGLDNFSIESFPHKVSRKDYENAQKFRVLLKGRHSANRGQNVEAPPMTSLTQKFTLDGDLDDWGDRGAFSFMDETEKTTRFRTARTPQGLVIAIDGRGNTSGELGNWKNAFREGFAIEVQIRNGERNQGGFEPREGDKRIVIGKYKGKWVGVLYQPRHPKGSQKSAMNLKSDTLEILIDEVRLLAANEVGIKVREKNLDIDLGGGSGGGLDLDLGGGGGFGMDTDLGISNNVVNDETKQGEGDDWSAEILIPWKLIGQGGGGRSGGRRFDVGIREAGSKRFFYWNNKFPGPRNDPAVEAYINPGAWGNLIFTEPGKAKR